MKALLADTPHPDNPVNPAQLSPELAGLFPPGVVAAELVGPGAPHTLLTQAEFNSMSHCAEKRIQDFTRGRACAHLALAGLGIRGFSLLAGERREPLWPTGIVGSITHTRGYGAAVVARQRDLRGLGVDCELTESVDEDLWPRICTPFEQQRLARLPALEGARQAALIFAAKEAFYKCQFPLTREWVGFEDVAIEPAADGSFRVVPQNPLPLDAGIVATLECRFLFRHSWVIVGICAPN